MRLGAASLLLLALGPFTARADGLELGMRSRLAQAGGPPVYVVPAPPGAYAPAPPPPSSGVGLIVAGSILLGLGVANLATAAICKTDAIARDLQDPCLYASIGVGVAFSGTGIPLLVVGASRRRAFKEWQRAHPVMAGLLEGVRLSTARGRAELLLGARF
jgi:hypothetical protein